MVVGETRNKTQHHYTFCAGAGGQYERGSVMRGGKMATVNWSRLVTPSVASPEGGGTGSEDGPWKSVAGLRNSKCKD